MRINVVVAECLTFLCLLQAPRSLDAATTEDRGTAIGTTVRSALNAAFPGTASLVDSIVGAIASKVRMNQTDKAAAKDAVKDTAAQLKNNANEQLTTLDTLATQLDVVTQFADASAAANEQVIPIISFLATHSHPTPAEWTASVKSQWDVIAAALKPLDGYDDATINKKVKDIYVNDLLRQIMSLKRNKVVALAALIQDKPQNENIPLIEKKLGEVQPILSSISRVASLQVQTLASDLHDVAAQAKQKQSVGDKEEKERRRRFDIIKARLDKT